VLACRVRQSDPTPVFHRITHSVPATPFQNAMASHESPELTLTNLLQLLTMPGCVGCGVAMPLPGFVGVPPGIRPTHTYVPACRVRQSRPPTPVFHTTKSSAAIGPFTEEIASHVSPGLTLMNLLQLLAIMPG
jgi:hypothetical protein